VSETERLRLSEATGDFAELVAAGTPTPGGGSVAAYSGVLAAALAEMVCNLTIGKKKYADAESRLKEIKAELERLRRRLGELIDEDAASFDRAMAAYRLPKDTDEQRAERAERIELALAGAAEVPYETARLSFEALKLIAELRTVGNPNAFSDLTVAAQLARTALRGAYYNVGINVSQMSDQDATGNMRQALKEMIAAAEDLTRQVEDDMLTRI
jgi:formiminotetrahydrofolate cyclodeaminase